MANNNNTRLSGAASIVREEDLTDMEDLQREIEDKIEQAHKDGRAFMMAQHVRILAMIKSEVGRLRRRFDRELLAGHRSAAKALKDAQRDKDEAQDDNQGDSQDEA
jgi:hypothetical protein